MLPSAQLYTRANCFWEQLPDYDASSLAEAQDISSDFMTVGYNATRSAVKRDPKLTKKTTGTTAKTMHESMFNHDKLTSAAMLMQDVRKLCKHTVFNGEHSDPIDWPAFGVVWQSVFDDPKFDALQDLVKKVKAKLSPDELRELEDKLATQFPGPPSAEPSKLDQAIEEVAHTIAYYVIDPERKGEPDPMPLATQLAYELHHYLRTQYDMVPISERSFEVVSRDALDFLSTKLPEKFVHKLLVPQRAIVDNFITGAALEQRQLLGKLAPPKSRDIP